MLNLKTIFGIGLTLLFLLLLWYIKAIVVYIIIAAIISLLGRPLVKLLNSIRFKNKNFPTSLSAIIILLFIMGVFIGIFSLFIPLVAKEARILSDIDFNIISDSLNEPMIDIAKWLEKYKVTSNQMGQEFLEMKLKGLFDFANVPDILKNLTDILGNIFTAIFSIIFITFFFLKEPQILYNIILTLTPDEHSDKVGAIINNIKSLLTRYFAGVIIQIVLVSNLIIFGLNMLDVKNAIIIGFLAGLLNIIPYLGPILGASFGIFIVITTQLELDFYTETLPLVGKIALIFGGVQLLDNLIFQPIIFSNSVNAHPLEIFLVILIAGTIMGIPGMIVAIPIYAILRVISKEFLSEYKIVKSLTKHL